MSKYHVALSFAGEDREYVEKVAAELRDHGVDVFYDKFEETKLWGKNLYTYLSEIYKDRALYTVMFISEHYKDKLWTNHERESAQARAFEESKEYILPVKFDNSVEIPGVLKTTGYISLESLSPESLALKIIEKLKDDGVSLSVDTKFSYSPEARADIDFTLPIGEEFSEIIKELKSYSWYTQNPAIEHFFKIDISKLTPDQLFIMGRNIYQCATGGERRSIEIIKNLRKEMAVFPIEAAEHLINGMFYEIYFNAEGEFRGLELKARYLNELLGIQSVAKYKECISFIRKSLKSYSHNLAILPSESPEEFEIEITIKKQDHPLIISVKHKDKELIVDYKEDDSAHERIWKLSFRSFTISGLKGLISSGWYIPKDQIIIKCNESMPEDTAYKLPKNKIIRPPFEY